MTKPRNIHFDILTSDYDIDKIHAQIDAFCSKSGLSEEPYRLKHVIYVMLSVLIAPDERPVSIGLSTGLSGTILTVSVENLHISPLGRENADLLAVRMVRSMAKSIAEEDLPAGYLLTLVF